MSKLSFMLPLHLHSTLSLTVASPSPTGPNYYFFLNFNVYFAAVPVDDISLLQQMVQASDPGKYSSQACFIWLYEEDGTCTNIHLLIFNH